MKKTPWALLATGLLALSTIPPAAAQDDETTPTVVPAPTPTPLPNAKPGEGGMEPLPNAHPGDMQTEPLAKAASGLAACAAAVQGLSEDSHDLIDKHNYAVSALFGARPAYYEPGSKMLFAPTDKVIAAASGQNATAKKMWGDVLCAATPSVWSLIRHSPDRLKEFQQMPMVQEKKALAEAVAALQEMQKQKAQVVALANKIAADAKKLHDSISPNPDKTLKTSLTKNEQGKILSLLIAKTGDDLSLAPDADKRTDNPIIGSPEVLKFYAGMNDLTKPGTAAYGAMDVDQQQAIGNDRSTSEADGQAFTRKMMRSVYVEGKGSGKPGSLNNVDAKAGKELYDAYYKVRSALNTANDFASRFFPDLTPEKLNALKAQAAQETAKRKAALDAKKKNIAGITAGALFDASNLNPEDRDAAVESLAPQIARHETVNGNNIVFSVPDKTGKNQSISIPASEFSDKNKDSLMQNPKFQQVVEALKTDKKVAGVIGGLGLAIKPPPELEKKEPAPAPTGDLTVDKDKLAKAAEQQAVTPDTLAKIKEAGPGCTTNAEENYRDNIRSANADKAKDRINERENAQDDRDGAVKSLAKQQKKDWAAAKDAYDSCVGDLNRLKGSGDIEAGDYSKGVAACEATRKQAEDSANAAFEQGKTKANGDFTARVKAAGSKKQISQWEKDANQANDNEVTAAYNQDIGNQMPAIQQKYATPDGRGLLRPNLAKSDPSNIIGSYMAERWGNPPKAMDDCREYIRKHNIDVDKPSSNYDTGAKYLSGVDQYLVEVDFPKWYANRRKGIDAGYKGSAPSSPQGPASAKPGTPAKNPTLEDIDQQIDSSKK